QESWHVYLLPKKSAEVTYKLENISTESWCFVSLIKTLLDFISLITCKHRISVLPQKLVFIRCGLIHGELAPIKAHSVKPPGIKGVKLTDVKSLFKFMDQDSIDWIEVLLEENAPQLLEDSTVEEISDEDVMIGYYVITEDPRIGFLVLLNALLDFRTGNSRLATTNDPGSDTSSLLVPVENLRHTTVRYPKLTNQHLQSETGNIQVKPPGIKGVKLTDVKSLLKFMDQDSIDWIEVLLEENAPQLLEDSTVEEISDEDVV
ncbi:hypothetical protein C0J52_24276, partial [Blattella germanica]